MRSFSKHTHRILVTAMILSLSGADLIVQAGRARRSLVAERVSAAAPARVDKAFGRLPLRFEANQGQTDARVSFLARGRGYTLFLTATEAVLRLRSAEFGRRNESLSYDSLTADNLHSALRTPPSAVLRMKLVGAVESDAQGVGLEELPGKVNYFIGSEPSRWRTEIPTFAKTRFREVYPGVDLVYYGNEGELEYDFVVAPGANPQAIALEFEGADKIEVDGEGGLTLHVAGEQVQQHKPVIYQEVDGARRAVAGAYELSGTGRVSFRLGPYDAAQPLVIDPVLIYATYLGGGRSEAISSITTDTSGNAYVVGVTDSTDFPTTNPAQPNPGGGNCSAGPCTDAFVTKLNAAGSEIMYSTYLGGNNLESGSGIAVDAAGNAYISGTTGSPNFPTAQARQPNLKGAADAFVAKLNAAGNQLVYSTYLGGGGQETGAGIAVDGAGNAAVTGITLSTDFPTEQPLRASFGGGTCGSTACPDAYITKLNAGGTGLLYSTYLGGNHLELGSGIAMDPSGAIYVTGTTASTNFPTSSNAFQPNLKGGICGSSPCLDAFVTKLNPIVGGAASLVYSTYLGGGQGGASGSSQPSDFSFGIAADEAGNAYVTGVTGAHDFPLKNAFQDVFRGGRLDIFVTKLNTNLSGAASLAYSTYLGGESDENFPNLAYSTLGVGNRCVAADAAGNVYVTGTSLSVEYPLKDDLPTFGSEEDAVVTKLNTNAAGEASLLFSTFLGGNGKDTGLGLALDGAGNIYVSGETNSSVFPVEKPVQGALKGTFDSFIVKIDEAAMPVADLALEKTHTGNFFAGGSGIYTLNVINGGNGATTGPITVTDTLPAGLSYIGASGQGWSCTASGQTVTCINPGPIATGAISFFHLNVTIAPGTAGSVVNTATVSTAGDPNPVNNTANDPTTIVALPTTTVVSVSAAHYLGPEIATESIVSGFSSTGKDLATGEAGATSLPLPTTLAGTTLQVTDSTGTTRLAPLFYVSPGQINYQLPPDTALGGAFVIVTSGDGKVTTGMLQVVPIAPGIFSANSNGKDVAAAVAIRVKADGTQLPEPVAQYDNNLKKFVPLPIDLGPETEQVVLLLFGTGIRKRSAVQVQIGGVAMQVDYAGAQGGYVGLDQINVRLSRALLGRGEVEARLTVDGKPANSVTLQIK